MTRDSGFSLLEAIVALAVVGASLGLLMQGLGANARAVKLSEDKYVATLLAQSNIHRVGFDIALETSLVQDSANGYARELEIAPRKGQDGAGGPLDVYVITSRVFWGPPGDPRSVELVTARTRAAGSDPLRQE